MIKNSATARPGGGFNQGFGDSFGEHMDENAMQQAVQQKALAQQNASAAGAGGGAQQPAAQQRRAPKPVGSLGEELISDPIKRIGTELKSFFSIHSWLGIEPAQDDPEKQAKQQQMMQNFNKLTAEEQEVFKRRYQEDMQKKKVEEEEKERRKQQEAQRQSQELPMPSTPQKGPQGPGGNKKQKAVQKLQNDRKSLGGPSSAN